MPWLPVGIWKKKLLKSHNNFRSIHPHEICMCELLKKLAFNCSNLQLSSFAHSEAYNFRSKLSSFICQFREISAFFPKKIRPSYFPDKRINFELVENSSRFLRIPAINCISSQKADSYENFSLWFHKFCNNNRLLHSKAHIHNGIFISFRFGCSFHWLVNI